ncbi:F0F1 ATP synthase subunit delta [Bacillus kwashiorkori]|uniref:F0F1 ATP synthase subunit delta n=1 Tax=Bacillus kwashiorkori TaxID=1522318 RepID=UPI0007828C01|nr:F0F1 ATP synthase subunit delta [Bacillus kwashiorkori]
MRHSKVANRYAVALFQLAVEHNQVDKMEADLRLVNEVFSTSSELVSILSTPKIHMTKKRELIVTNFSSLSPFVVNTLLLLVERHRSNEIVPMTSQFIQYANELKGIAEAKVISTRLLTEEEKLALSETFAKKVNKISLQIENQVDTDLLGGLKIQIGNRIFDGSLRGKLDRLKHELIGYQS